MEVWRPSVFLLASLIALSAISCAEELLPTEPEGAYLIWRQALLEGNADVAYDHLDEQTRAVFEERVEVLNVMSEDILRYLPRTDQRLARQQTGAVLLKEKGIEDGRGLFKVLFKPEAMKVTPEIEVGTEVSSVEINETGDEAAIVVYAGQQFLLRKEEDGIWRITSWRTLSLERTQWILDNRDALEQTVQDLINEEKEEMDAVIKYLLDEEARRRKAAEEQKK